MVGLRTASANTAGPIRQAASAVSADQAASTEVLITEHELLFSTAAAVPAQRDTSFRRFVASVRAICAVSAPESRPQRRGYPKRHEFLERALMGREMDRL